jgi:hypothetical protein
MSDEGRAGLIGDVQTFTDEAPAKREWERLTAPAELAS